MQLELPPAFLLAAAASILFVILDVLRKLLGERLSAAQIVIGINSGAALVFLLFLLRYGGWEYGWIFLALSGIGIVTFTVSSVLYVRAVTLSPLSLTIPYLAFTPVVSAIVALVTLGEIPTLRGFAGVLLVVVGALLMHLEPGKGLRELAAAPFREPGSLRMLIVALIWGVTTTLDKVAIRHGSEALLGLFLTLGSTLLLLILTVLGLGFGSLQGKAARPARELLLYLAAGVAAGAVLAQYFAYRELLVAYVETIKRAGGLLSALIGVVCFREGGFAHRIPAASLMLLGIGLIMF